MNETITTGLEVLIGILILLGVLCIIFLCLKVIDWFFDAFKEEKDIKQKELNETYKRGFKDGRKSKKLHQ